MNVILRKALVDDATVFGNGPPLALARSCRKPDSDITQRCPKIIDTLVKGHEFTALTHEGFPRVVALVYDVRKIGSADVA